MAHGLASMEESMNDGRWLQQMLTFVSGLLPCLPINPQYIWRKTISHIEVVLGSGVFPVLQ